MGEDAGFFQFGEDGGVDRVVEFPHEGDRGDLTADLDCLVEGFKFAFGSLD